MTYFKNIRSQFPLLTAHPELIYLDNAASTHKPDVVLHAMDAFYREEYANVHRGVYDLSERATTRYEDARAAVAHFLNVTPQEIIFTKNATEAINVVAYSWGMRHIHEGDEIVVSILEHHANFVPWQRLCAQKKARLRVAPAGADGMLDEEKICTLITNRTKLIALTALSNVTGAVTPLEKTITQGKKYGAKILIDGAQAVAHSPWDARALGTDFFVFSGHKIFGPTGIGVLFARTDTLEHMEPFIVGGEMVKTVSLEKTEWQDAPWKFEAGTPPIAEAIGLESAIKFIQSIGWKNIQAYDHALTEYALEKLNTVNGITVVGTHEASPLRAPIISFAVKGVHPHDLASILNDRHIAIRSGHFCAQPLINAFGYNALARASCTIYTTPADIDALTEGIRAAQKTFRV